MHSSTTHIPNQALPYNKAEAHAIHSPLASQPTPPGKHSTMKFRIEDQTVDYGFEDKLGVCTFFHFKTYFHNVRKMTALFVDFVYCSEKTTRAYAEY